MKEGWKVFRRKIKIKLKGVGEGSTHKERGDLVSPVFRFSLRNGRPDGNKKRGDMLNKCPVVHNRVCLLYTSVPLHSCSF